MNMHDAWRSEAVPATGDQLQMDELTARQLADELTTLASSMFGLLQPHPGADPAQAEDEAAFEIALAEAMPVADPASVVSVAIPSAPAVAMVAQDDGAPPAALAVPALAVPEVPEGLDKLDQRESEPEGLDKLDQRESELQRLDPLDPRVSLTLLSEIAFLDE
jgi:hypothetical protein